MRFIRTFAIAALAALSFNAHAGLTTYAPWDATYPGIAGVQFNVVTAANGASIAMGAHPYIYGVTMANNGVDTYYASAGRTTPTRANWSFDFAWDYGQCSTCSVQLFVDTDPTGGVTWAALPIPGIDSWNMEFNFMAAALGGYDFDPFSASSTAFSLRLFDNGQQIANSDIVVNVPEPGSIALFGLGLLGLGAVARRRKSK